MQSLVKAWTGLMMCWHIFNFFCYPSKSLKNDSKQNKTRQNIFFCKIGRTTAFQKQWWKPTILLFFLVNQVQASTDTAYFWMPSKRTPFEMLNYKIHSEINFVYLKLKLLRAKRRCRRSFREQRESFLRPHERQNKALKSM